MRSKSPRCAVLRAATLFLPAILFLSSAAWRVSRSGFPLPAVHDEFSYLLAAETFAHGRLANPSPPFPEFFETIHVLVVPTYVSIYPPAQGLWLALVQVAFGHPWWGVLLSSVLFLVATGWAALAWLRPAWALGAAFTAMGFVLGTNWSESYWGGSVAALGGALVLGAAGRIRKIWTAVEPEDRHPARTFVLAALWAAGATMAFLARPYEGGLLLLLSAIELGRLWLRMPSPWLQKRAELFRCLAAATPVCGAGLGFLLACNQAATGSPLRMAYMEHARQYQIRRTFLWQKDRPEPSYRHASIRDVYRKLVRRDLTARQRLAVNWRMFEGQYGSIKMIGPGLAGAILWGAGAGLGWVTSMVFAGLGAVLMIVWINPHYYAPYAAFLAVAVAGGLSLWARLSFRGWSAAWPVVLLWVALLGSRFWWLTHRMPERPEFSPQRAAVLRRLEALPGRHLVLVKYGPDHNWLNEWVYNCADLDGAKVLWARWHETEKLGAFLAHHRDRKAWLLEADQPGTPLAVLANVGDSRSVEAGAQSPEGAAYGTAVHPDPLF
jgi:hypothetical protein